MKPLHTIVFTDEHNQKHLFDIYRKDDKYILQYGTKTKSFKKRIQVASEILRIVSEFEEEQVKVYKKR